MIPHQAICIFQLHLVEIRIVITSYSIHYTKLYDRFTWAYLDSTIIQELTVYRDSRRIDFVTRVDWQERQQLLKAAFHVGVRATEATYDIQYGNVKRPTHWNTSWDYARFETVGHQWADLSERNYGVSLLNDCKYGYDIKDHVMRLSLLKSAIYPDPEADRGQHEFTYSLLPHKGDWLDGGTAGEAWSLNHPLQAYKGTSYNFVECMLYEVITVFMYYRRYEGETWLVTANFSGEAASLELPEIGSADEFIIGNYDRESYNFV